jgi:SSS family solute:Na+ symporter
MDIAILSTFIVYFGTLLTIGFYFLRARRTTQSFMLGGRSANYLVTAIAAQASDMGAWLFLGFPAAVYTTGMSGCWIAIGLVFFTFLDWQFIAPRLRTYTEALNSVTLSSFFAARFNDTNGYIRLVSAVFSLLFFTFYIASGLVGLGRLFESAFEMNYHTGILLGLITTTIFTLAGGFLAVAWSNLFQGLFLLIMILIVPIFGFFMIDGVQAIITAAHARNVSLSLITDTHSIGNALNLLAWGLGYFGQPHILIYFMGIDDVRKIPYAKYIGLTWQILVLAAAISIGLVGIAFFNQGISNPELIFVTMTKTIFPPLLVGFILCAILAAVLSTLSSQILLSGSVIAEDLYKEFINRTLSQKQLVQITRISALAICLVSLGIAWNDSNTVFDLVSYAWSGLGSAFGPLVIAALYMKNTTHTGALAGMIVGGCVAAFWPYIQSTDIIPLVPGFFAGLCTIIGVSYITRK